MTTKEFSQILREVIPKKDAKLLDEHFFRIYDQNDDGEIDFTEFMTVVNIMNEGTPEENLERIFRVFDVDSDGVITKEEMVQIVASMFNLLKKDNPKIAAKEFIVSCSAFEESDTDKDGSITKEEFIKACLAREEFTTLLTKKIVDIFTEA